MLCYVAHLPRVIRAGVAVPPTVYRAQVKHVLLGIKTLLISIAVLHKCSLRSSYLVTLRYFFFIQRDLTI